MLRRTEPLPFMGLMMDRSMKAKQALHSHASGATLMGRQAASKIMQG